MVSISCLPQQTGLDLCGMMSRLCILAVVLPVWAGGGGARAAKVACNSKELKGRDCRLSSGSYSLRLLDKTIAWNDGTWHTVDPMPLSGEGVEWEKASFSLMGGKPIVQLWIWDKGVGETQVQSLHWFVADAEKRKFTVLAQGVVRKRQLKQPLVTEEEGAGGAGAPVAKKGTFPKKPPGPKYLYDAMEPHSLKVVKSGLEWTLGRDKKLIER